MWSSPEGAVGRRGAFDRPLVLWEYNYLTLRPVSPSPSPSARLDLFLSWSLPATVLCNPFLHLSTSLLPLAYILDRHHHWKPTRLPRLNQSIPSTKLS